MTALLSVDKAQNNDHCRLLWPCFSRLSDFSLLIVLLLVINCDFYDLINLPDHLSPPLILDLFLFWQIMMLFMLPYYQTLLHHSHLPSIPCHYCFSCQTVLQSEYDAAYSPLLHVHLLCTCQHYMLGYLSVMFTLCKCRMENISHYAHCIVLSLHNWGTHPGHRAWLLMMFRNNSSSTRIFPKSDAWRSWVMDLHEIASFYSVWSVPNHVLMERFPLVVEWGMNGWMDHYLMAVLISVLKAVSLMLSISVVTSSSTGERSPSKPILHAFEFETCGMHPPQCYAWAEAAFMTCPLLALSGHQPPVIINAEAHHVHWFHCRPLYGHADWLTGQSLPSCYAE